MIVKDIIKMVCEFVGEKEIFSKLISSLPLNESEEGKVNVMLRCFNLVNQEIASDYLPFLEKEEIEDENGILNFSKFKKKVVNIYEVRGHFGRSLTFKLFPNYAEVSGKVKSVVYSYFPEELTLESEVVMQCGLSARVYAYGVASEYLLIDGISGDRSEERRVGKECM